MTPDLIGAHLGKYEIQAEIGKGGMGRVYLGYDPMLDRKVAVKVLAPHLVWEPGFVERFLREARAAARLKHPGIVTIYDVGQEGKHYYFVMEYLEGQTLSRIIRQRGPLPADQVLFILRRLASALDYAHRAGLIHRDVKPGNVIVSPEGQVTLTDFGVARAAQETRLTTTGALLGTPQYMSPEQAQGDPVDYCTDIYSLGVAAYEMLAGRTPFAATTPHAVLHQLIYEPPPPVRARRPDLPAEVDRVMDRVLAKKPGDRYGAAREFVSALEQALGGQAPPEPALAPPSGPAPAPPTGPRPGPQAPARQAAPARTAQPCSVGWGLWFGWLLASALSMALGWAIGAPLGEAVAYPLGQDVDIALAELLGGMATWGLVGIVTGAAQWLVLRRHIRRAGWWVLASSLGWAVVGLVQWPLGQTIAAVVFETMGGLEEIGLAVLLGAIMGGVHGSVSGLVVGAAQWLVLQRQRSHAGRWVLISLLAWAIGGATLGTAGWLIGESLADMGVDLLLFAGIAPGAVTGAGLVWLLSQRPD